MERKKKPQKFKNSKRHEENKSHRKNVKHHLKLGLFEDLPLEPKKSSERTRDYEE